MSAATATPPVEKKEKEKLPSVYPTAEAVQAEATGRTKGPKRAFACTHAGKTIYCVANNEGRAGGIAFAEIGGKVAELGSKAKKQKAPANVAGIMEAVGQLPEAERAAVLAQLKALVSAPSGKK